MNYKIIRDRVDRDIEAWYSFNQIDPGWKIWWRPSMRYINFLILRNNNIYKEKL